MSEMDVIRDLAKQVLTVTTLSGRPDNSLWDRAQRLVRNVERICRLPEIANSGLQNDRFCLLAATYFADAGLSRYLDTKNLASKVVLADISRSDLTDFSTQLIGEKLTGAVTDSRIEKINKIILESDNRFTNMNEAMILSDARNLDDMGAVGIFNEFRKYVLHGKGVSDALKSWKRKIDYQYWHARFKESFRLDAVRELAKRRFGAAELFMSQLAVENNAQDLDEFILEHLQSDAEDPDLAASISG